MPDWQTEIRRRLADLRLEPTREAEIAEEMAQHLDDRYTELRASGVAEAEARTAALAELSCQHMLWQQLRRVEQRASASPVVLGARRETMIRGLWQDLRYGARALIRNPGFAFVAVITLALGIGANTAIFSVVNGVLLNPLPYQDPERLALIRLDWRGVSGQAGIAPAEVIDFRERTQLFEGFEIITTNNSSLTGENMEKIPSVTVTEGLIPLLGVRPLLGSGHTEMAADGQKHIWDVVISYELWQRRFGGAPDIIGRKIAVNNSYPAVVGVMPAGFRIHLGPGTNVPEQVDLFFLGSLTEDGLGVDRDSHDITTLARLKPGVSFEQAQGEIDAIAADLTAQYPKAYENSNFKFHLAPLHKDLVRKVKLSLLALLGAVGFVLAVACANVANLVMTRTDARAKELAIRCALGAGRWRIIRQLVTENLLLCLLGGGGGLLIASQGIRLLLLLRPADLPRQDAIRIDTTVLVAALLASLFAGVVLGLIPAWQATRADVNEGLKEGGRQSSGGQGKLRNLLVIAEVALSLVLLIGAGLMIRTFAKLNRVDWGFQPDRLLTLQVNIKPSGFKDTKQRWQFYQQAVEKIRALPGVDSVSGVSPLPLKGESAVVSYALDETATTPLSASLYTVLPDYFEVMGIRPVAGRAFTPLDIEQSLPLVIIDENLAKQAWPGEDPLGKKLLRRPRSKQQQWLEVIGVVEHVKADGFREDGRPQMYVSYLNYPLFDLDLVVRTQAGGSGLAPVIKDEVERLGTQRPVHSFRMMDDYVSRQLSETRFALILMGILALIALALCLVGLYSVVAYAVSRRTHEIGIRIALGAQQRHVLKMILGEGLVLIGAGLGLGLPASLVATQVLASLLYGVSATDTATFAGVVLLLISVALVACYLPARRASRLDPMIALHHE